MERDDLESRAVFDEALPEELSAGSWTGPAPLPYEPPKVLIFPVSEPRRIVPAYMGNQ